MSSYGSEVPTSSQIAWGGTLRPNLAFISKNSALHKRAAMSATERVAERARKVDIVPPTRPILSSGTSFIAELREGVWIKGIAIPQGRSPIRRRGRDEVRNKPVQRRENAKRQKPRKIGTRGPSRSAIAPAGRGTMRRAIVVQTGL